MKDITQLTAEDAAELEELHQCLALALEVLEEDPEPEIMESSVFPVLIF